MVYCRPKGLAAAAGAWSVFRSAIASKHTTATDGNCKQLRRHIRVPIYNIINAPYKYVALYTVYLYRIIYIYIYTEAAVSTWPNDRTDCDVCSGAQVYRQSTRMIA